MSGPYFSSAMPGRLAQFFGDRIQINALLIVGCFGSVLVLGSQSAASYPSYILTLSMLITFRRWNDVFRTPLVWVVVALLSYLCLTIFWSEPHALREGLGLVARALLVFTFVVAMGECELRGQARLWLGRALAILGSASAAAAILFYLLDPPADGRLSGLGQLDNPVVVGLVFAVVLVLLLDMLLEDFDRRWRLAGLVGAAFALAAVVLSGSRNAWASAVIGSLVVVFASRIQDPQRFLAALVALSLVILVALGALFLGDDGRELLFPRGSSFRLEIWSVVMRDLIDGHLMFGRGILTPDHVYLGETRFDHPHSMYLAVLFQGGIVALLLLLVVAFWTLSELFATYEQRSARLALGLLATGLTSYVVDGHELIDKVGETWFLFWLPVGIALGLSWNRARFDVP